MKDIYVAKSAGFCWGVQRAFDKVLEVAANNGSSHKTFTYGPLIHNPQAVKMLEDKGVKLLKEIPEHISGVVAIRTHGLPPDERKKLLQAGAKLCDATCPDVGYIQGIVKRHVRQGYFVIIIGSREHPEVEALLGFGEGKSACVLTKEDILALPEDFSKVCVVSQSTQQQSHFQELVSVIKERYSNCKVYDTICRSTAQRQQEVKEFAKKVDAIVVVGGRNSANTTRLAEISRQMGASTWHVEGVSELRMEDFKDAKTIGVTAGASTPRWVIEEVVERLKSF
ncbi:MAG: 4-hydroxy-3-methylbut-2-enyl diphosphate reductase [Pseudomonadota bacterium]